MGRQAAERECGQCNDQAGDPKPAAGETTVRNVSLLLACGKRLKCVLHRSQSWPSDRSLIWHWLSDLIQVSPKSSKSSTSWVATRKVKPALDSCVSSQNIQLCLTWYFFPPVFIGIGNVTLCAEFNFAMDPESAYIVLEEFLCPTYVASWEYSCRNSLPWVRQVLVKNYSTLWLFETDLSAFTCAGVLQWVDKSGCTRCSLHEENNIQMLGLL